MAARGRRADPHDEVEAQTDLRKVRGRDRGAVRGLTAHAGEEALEVGRRVWETFNAGERSGFWGLIHPECTVVTDPRWPDGGEFHGIEEFRRFMDRFLDAFGGIRFQPESEPEAFDDVALFHGRWVGAGAASGIETASVPFWVVQRARDGLLGEARFFFAEAEAREAASPP